MSVQVFKDGKGELIEPDLLHQYMESGYTLEDKPVKKEKPKQVKEES